MSPGGPGGPGTTFPTATGFRTLRSEPSERKVSDFAEVWDSPYTADTATLAGMAPLTTPHRDRVQVHVYVPQEVRMQLKVQAALMGISMSGAAQYLIEEAIAVRSALNIDRLTAVTTDQVLAAMREPLVAQPKESSF